MADFAAYLAIWFGMAVLLAIPAGKALRRLGQHDRDFVAEHEVWAKGEIFRDAAWRLAEQVESTDASSANEHAMMH